MASVRSAWIWHLLETAKQILKTPQETLNTRPRAGAARHHKPDSLTKSPLSERMNDLGLRSVSDSCLNAGGPKPSPCLQPVVIVLIPIRNQGDYIKLESAVPLKLLKFTEQKEYDFGILAVELTHVGAFSANTQTIVTQLWYLLGSLLAVVPVDTTVPNKVSEMLSEEAVVQHRGWGQ